MQVVDTQDWEATNARGTTGPYSGPTVCDLQECPRNPAQDDRISPVALAAPLNHALPQPFVDGAQLVSTDEAPNQIGLARDDSRGLRKGGYPLEILLFDLLCVE